MKKTLLLMSLMALPVITSCNKVDAKKIDSQEELMAALTFKDINYVQVMEDNKFQYTCSPTVYRYTSTENKASPDKFVEKIGEHYVKYTKDAGTDTWDIDNATKDDFLIPGGLYNTFELNKIFSEAVTFSKVLTYDDFDYVNGQYVCKVNTDQEGNKVDFTMEFNNKRVTKLNMVTTEEENDRTSLLTFTYNEVTPVTPTI